MSCLARRVGGRLGSAQSSCAVIAGMVAMRLAFMLMRPDQPLAERHWLKGKGYGLDTVFPGWFDRMDERCHF